MRAAGWRHGARFTLLVACVLGLAAWGWNQYQWMQARVIVARLLAAPVTGAQAIIEEMAPLRRRIDRILRLEAGRLPFQAGDPRPLNLSLALLPTDSTQAEVLR